MIVDNISPGTSANNTNYEAKLAITSAIITGNNISLVVLTKNVALTPATIIRQ